MKKKKIRVGSEEFFRIIVNKSLEEFEVSYDYVLKNPIIKGENWYDYYWHNNESYIKFDKWLRKFIVNKTDCMVNKVDNTMAWYHLLYGLKVY